MVDLSKTIEPKSDQTNYDDFISGESKTIKITDIKGSDTKEQPIIISYEGDRGKPYKPCLSMRRVLVHCWGKNGRDYIGRSLTLYGDPTVRFGGLAVGGIRIAAMSHIEKPITMALTATRANKKPFTVRPLGTYEKPSLDDLLADIATAPNIEGLELKYKAAWKEYPDDEARTKIKFAKDKRKSELAAVV